jgi:hypothetical protein
MKKYKHSIKKQGGALVTVLTVTLMIGVAGASMINFATQQVYSVDRQRSIMMSRSLAEAGANEAFRMLRNDWDVRESESAFPEKDFGGGTYDVTVTPVGSDKAIIESVGSYDDVEMDVVLDVRLASNATADTLDPETNPYAHTIFTLGDLRCNGSGQMIGSAYSVYDFRINGSSTWNADVMAKASATVIGGTTTISGEVWSPSIGGSGIGGIASTKTSAVPLVPFPTLDLNEYYQIAAANGQVYSGSNDASGSIGVIPGGVRWYNGDVRFKGGVNYTGCIIATGSVKFQGGATTTRVGNLPCVVSRDSYVQVNGSHTMEGLIYATSYITLNGSGTIDGSMIAGGDITLNGSYGIITYVNSTPGDSAPDDTEAGELYLSVWQK